MGSNIFSLFFLVIEISIINYIGCFFFHSPLLPCWTWTQSWRSWCRFCMMLQCQGKRRNSVVLLHCGINVDISMCCAFSYANSWCKCLFSAINDPDVLIHASWLLCIKGLVIVIFWYITVTPIRSTQEHGAELKVRCCLVKLYVSQLLVHLLYFFTDRSLLSGQIIHNFL